MFTDNTDVTDFEELIDVLAGIIAKELAGKEEKDDGA